MNDKWGLDSNKLLWHMPRIYTHYINGKRIVPITIDIGITKFCNIKCEFCYGIHQKMTGDMIPPAALVQLFKDAPKLGIKGISIVGDGEPTLHPALIEAVEAGAENGLDMAMATNGVKMTNEAIATLLYRLVWLRFNVSAIEEGYEVVHGRPYWPQVRGNIEKCVAGKQRKKLPVTIGLQMVLTKNALPFVLREARYAIDAGVDYFVVKQCSDPKEPGMVVPEEEWFDHPDVMKILHQAEAMSTDRTKIVVKFQAIASRHRRPYNHCYDVPLLFQISGDGKCYPCGYLFGDPRYCYGDLVKQSLGEILNSERYWAIVEHMKTKFDVHTECAGHCRHQSTNAFMEGFLNPPDHLSFV